MTIYNRNPQKDAHQHAIVGGSLPLQNQGSAFENKELKQRNFADELKRQIEERDFYRKKEEWRKTKAASFVDAGQPLPS